MSSWMVVVLLSWLAIDVFLDGWDIALFSRLLDVFLDGWGIALLSRLLDVFLDC